MLFLKGKKIIRLLYKLCIILKHLIWRFRIYNLFCEKFRFYENMNTLKNLRNLFLYDPEYQKFSPFGHPKTGSS